MSQDSATLPRTLKAKTYIAAARLRCKVSTKNEVRVVRAAMVADLKEISDQVQRTKPEGWGDLDFTTTRNERFTKL